MPIYIQRVGRPSMASSVEDRLTGLMAGKSASSKPMAVHGSYRSIRTRRNDPNFGDARKMNLTLGPGQPIDPSQYTVTSPPLIVGDVVIVGSAIIEDSSH